jgi:hypothetical protein
MKKFISSTLLMICLITNGIILMGQNLKDPTIYLNSEKIDIHKLFINPERIDSIKRNTDSHEIYIYTKKGKFPYYSVGDIVKEYSKIKGHADSILFRLNGKIINDTTFVKIDKSYYVYVDIEILSDVKYLSSNFRNLLVANIDLEVKKREPKIYIRGGDQDILEEFKNK